MRVLCGVYGDRFDFHEGIGSGERCSSTGWYLYNLFGGVFLHVHRCSRLAVELRRQTLGHQADDAKMHLLRAGFLQQDKFTSLV